MPYLSIKEPLTVLLEDSGYSSQPSKPLVVQLVVALPLLTIKSPSRHSLPSSCRRAVHRHSAAPSIRIHSVVLSVHRRRARAVP